MLKADQDSSRAGRYLNQPAGYRAFLASPLPPDPPLRIEAELRQALSAADQALGRLDGSVETLPNPNLFVYMYVRKESVLSSQIEEYRRRITDQLGRAAGNGHRVLEHLYERPIISVNDVRALTQTSFPAANQLVQRLVEIGVLAEITGQARHRRFRYEPYGNLFS